MSLTRSLSNGASSLQAHQRRFDVISNNIANANTVGYKSSRTTFADQLSQTYSYGKSPDHSAGRGVGGVNPLQYGLGVKVGSVTLDMGQGTLELTNRPLDLAIQGDGMFVYNMKGTQLFSRAGAISRDKEGYFVDSASGAFLQGYNVIKDANGRIQKDSEGKNVLGRKVENLLISPNVLSDPRQTENVSVIGNLNSTSASGTQRTTSITIYDNQGATHNLELTFTKTANPNEYILSATLDGANLTLPNNTILFNADGTLNSPTSIVVSGTALNTAINSTNFSTAKSLRIKLADPNSLTNGLTQYAMPSSATASEQDGYQVGSLIELNVDYEGKIWGSFTNGQSEVLGQVVIAKFANQAALTKQGNNFFVVSPNSGSANIGTAGELFPSSKISSKTLEQSNVEMTQQFTDIISTQRAFEASARVITITDQMLAEINLLRR